MSKIDFINIFNLLITSVLDAPKTAVFIFLCQYCIELVVSVAWRQTTAYCVMFIIIYNIIIQVLKRKMQHSHFTFVSSSCFLGSSLFVCLFVCSLLP